MALVSLKPIVRTSRCSYLPKPNELLILHCGNLFASHEDWLLPNTRSKGHNPVNLQSLLKQAATRQNKADVEMTG